MPETSIYSDPNSASSQLLDDTKKATRRRAKINLIKTAVACVTIGVAVNLIERQFAYDFSTEPISD